LKGVRANGAQTRLGPMIKFNDWSGVRTVERALDIWDRKRCVPCARRIREQIDSLGLAKV
jgi:hypothetical protein